MSDSVGFRILGGSAGDRSGWSVRGVGDVNNDRIDDFIIGASDADLPGALKAGISYVIYGRNLSNPASSAFGDIQLTNGTALPADLGFRILGALAGENSGWSVGAAGDMNHDGVGDILVSAYFASPPSRPRGGITYVLFGRSAATQVSNPFGDIQLTTGGTALSPSVGFRVLGAGGNDWSGTSVSATGDVNGDGVDDIIIGVPRADPPDRNLAGIAYVIFGRNIPGGAAAFRDIWLTSSTQTLPKSVGFRIMSGVALDQSLGFSVSGTGDVNGDGINDVIVGAYQTSGNGISYVVFGTPAPPTSQPSPQPSRQPSRQPTMQPTHQPSRQPSGQPSQQSSRQPSGQPTTQPSSQPSKQPSSQPTIQPNAMPTTQPSKQPSAQPSKGPTRQPTSQPSTQPSRQPSAQPSMQPRSCPTARPSSQPTIQLSSQPSSQPSAAPSEQPSRQPSAQPSAQPIGRPTSQPSMLPSRQPSTQPSALPSTQPSTQPSIQPSTQPSIQPSIQPSTQPSRQPFIPPTSQPSGQPSEQPSVQPSARPSTQPSSFPSALPTVQPSNLPSQQPTTQPSSQPTSQPSFQPSRQPSMRPSVQPSSQPSAQPSGQPSMQSTINPSHVPSALPSVQPTLQPSAHPSTQPSAIPSQQPITQPSKKPRGEWLICLNNTTELHQVVVIGNVVWVCGLRTGVGEIKAFCTQIDAEIGTERSRFRLPWTDVTSVFRSDDESQVLITGRTIVETSITSTIATCIADNMQLICNVRSVQDANIAVAVYASSVKQNVYIGTYGEEVMVSFANTMGTFRTLLFANPSGSMSRITISHAQNVPLYVGTFVAGTCVSTASVNYVFAGVVRTDTGIMNAMYLTPARGRIINSAELVNAMALENSKADSFIAGGLQLDDGDSMHAYLLRVNSIFNDVVYAVRYRVQKDTDFTRRRFLRGSISTHVSVVTGAVLVDAVLYMIVDVINTASVNLRSSVSIVKVNIATGSIVQQVQIESPTADIRCSHIATPSLTSGDDFTFLYITCTTSYPNGAKEALLLSCDKDLTLSALPAGFRKYQNSTLVAERVTFYRSLIPLTARSGDIRSEESTFSVSNDSPTLQPSEGPTSVPSMLPLSAPTSHPSSSPTAAPSVSPQPTSQPSTSGPTNTYKPTIKPTTRPSTNPSIAPTVTPSKQPSLAPTRAPTMRPSGKPSTMPSATPTAMPTRAPTTKSTYIPTTLRTVSPTDVPSAVPSVAENGTTNGSYAFAMSVMGYCVGGLLAAFLLYQLVRWCLHKQRKLRKRVAYMRATGLPAKPQYPIFAVVFGFFYPYDAQNGEVSGPPVPPVILNVPPNAIHSGVVGTAVAPAPTPTPELIPIPVPVPIPVIAGAFINSPRFSDIEVNNQSNQDSTVSNHTPLNASTNNMAAAETSEPAQTAPVQSNKLAVESPTSSSIEVEPDLPPLTMTPNSLVRAASTTSSVHGSDNSSFLSDLVNNMLQSDVSDSSHSDSSESDGDDTGSSKSVNHATADNMV